MSENRACKGGLTISCCIGSEHAQKCVHCHTKVRDDMVNHRFFGFAAGCSDPKPTKQKSAAVAT